ncbi:hypothetical protein [Solwaraspora sp. WMMD792]|uniref:hypothetical protein n=1 Tax=Solwaraspora sp. WMMD792 TaxID=3016099 RepID=UPI0024172066|nr:hypothetical protein [Solwaraspora sp. WMMD792]MDG4768758.1 hypothetical protein [Solwaraspora sp. WMMD792]MDG4768797.1 hypothetical protein [Solwaraspora sp. WMMD792]MDG4768837.1 hypothetical protein [Solwaraspora sp. WMMD792]MDG4768847.1 hypothetical protein [Solwaraspora sp. WMMD792]MDG4768880.1 hypothetical protein [Solwaraspora sp. WMMD792]
MRNRDLRRVQQDLAARRARTPAEAAERAHRGAALVRRALAGEPVPDPPQATAGPRPARPPVLDELVSCAGCYRPHVGEPGSLCEACAGAQPVRLDDIETGVG